MKQNTVFRKIRWIDRQQSDRYRRKRQILVQCLFSERLLIQLQIQNQYHLSVGFNQTADGFINSCYYLLNKQPFNVFKSLFYFQNKIEINRIIVLRSSSKKLQKLLQGNQFITVPDGFYRAIVQEPRESLLDFCLPLGELRNPNTFNFDIRGISNSFCKVLAIDCEMVLLHNGEKRAGHVVVVDINLQIIMDLQCKIEDSLIADYLTCYSGITKESMQNSTMDFQQMKSYVAELIQDSILVGHSVFNDLKSLDLIHPLIIDTAILYSRAGKAQKLKILAQQYLQLDIQCGPSHNPAEDAIISMRLAMGYIFSFSGPLIKEQLKCYDINISGISQARSLQSELSCFNIHNIDQLFQQSNSVYSAVCNYHQFLQILQKYILKNYNIIFLVLTNRLYFFIN